MIGAVQIVTLRKILRRTRFYHGAITEECKIRNTNELSKEIRKHVRNNNDVVTLGGHHHSTGRRCHPRLLRQRWKETLSEILRVISLVLNIKQLILQSGIIVSL